MTRLLAVLSAAVVLTVGLTVAATSAGATNIGTRGAPPALEEPHRELGGVQPRPQAQAGLHLPGGARCVRREDLPAGPAGRRRQRCGRGDQDPDAGLGGCVPQRRPRGTRLIPTRRFAEPFNIQAQVNDRAGLPRSRHDAQPGGHARRGEQPRLPARARDGRGLAVRPFDDERRFDALPLAFAWPPFAARVCEALLAELVGAGLSHLRQLGAHPARASSNSSALRAVRWWVACFPLVVSRFTWALARRR